jgi:putative ABC transport system permease protein
MWKNYFKSTFRNIIRNKFISLISILSLAIGFACFLIILIYVKKEFSYEHSFSKYENIYRVGWNTILGGTESKTPYSNARIAKTLSEECNGVVSSTRLYYGGEEIIELNNQFHNELNFYYADSTFFDVFDVEFISGIKQNCLSQENSVVITEAIASKYFENKNPIGELIKTKNGYTYKVTGVCENFPNNSHLNKVDFLAPFSSLELSTSKSWANNYNYTYALISDLTNYKHIEKELNMITAREMDASIQRIMGVSFSEFVKNGNKYEYFLQPITDIHLFSDLENELPGNSNIRYVVIFLIIGAFIFIVSILNFVNLITAQSMTRSKEVGVRKVSGAKRKQVIVQFLSESAVYVFIGFLIGLVILESVIPMINRFYNQNLEINYFNPVYTLPITFVFLLIISILTGSYNAIVQSRLTPIDAIKDQHKPLSKNTLKYFFVLLQFIISIFLIISSLFVQKQLTFMYNKDLGFNPKDIIVIEGVDVLGDKQQFFKNELLKINNVKLASYSNCVPGIEQAGTFTYKKGESKDDVINVAYTVIDLDFLKTYGIHAYELKQIQNSKEIQHGDIFANEATIRQFNISDLYEDKLVISGGDMEFPITGVIKDFNFEPLFTQVTPYVLVALDWPKNILSVKLSGNQNIQTVVHIEKLFKEVSGTNSLNYFFLDEHLQSFYKNEELTKSLFTIFSIIIVLVAIFGLIGLTSFTFQQKVKEIGIRKTLGATKKQIFTLLTKRMGILIGISNLIAWPVAYYFVKQWLQNFAFAINVTAAFFILAFVVSYIILFISIIVITIKVSDANPVESLRYE